MESTPFQSHSEGFFDLLWSVYDNDSDVGRFASFLNLSWVNPFTGVGSDDVVLLVSLKESS